MSNLLSVAEVAPLLACPRCKAELRHENEALCCANESCPLSQQGAFKCAGAHPVFVDFDNSVLDKSALLKSGGARVATRHNANWIRRIVRALISPKNPVTRRNFDRFIDLIRRLPVQSKPVVLVIGGGAVGSAADRLYACDDLSLVAFDIYGSAMTQFIGDAHQIPIRSHSVDAIVIQAVLEHVLEPTVVAAEMRRVLKPGGLVYAETPLMQQVHAGPYDFTRFTDSGHRNLFRWCECIDSGVVGGLGTSLIWSIDYFVRGLCRSAAIGRSTRLLFFWLRFFDRLCGEPYSVDGASGVFFLGRTASHESTPHEIIAHYKGAQDALYVRLPAC